MRFRIFPKRLAAAAVLGAVFSLLTAIISSYADTSAVELPLAVICALPMTLIAFGGGMRKTLGSSAAYLAVNLGLGGLMTVLFSTATRLVGADTDYALEGAASASPALFIAITAVSAAVSLAYGRMKERAISKRRVNARLKAFGCEKSLTLMPDSGNLLTDPFTGKPVIILTAKSVEDGLPSDIMEAVHKKSPTIVDYTPKGLRLIPTSSLNGSGILLGFRPELVEIDGIAADAVVAIDPKNNDFDGCSGLVPISLIKI